MTPFGTRECSAGSGEVALKLTGQMDPNLMQRELAAMMRLVKPDKQEVRFTLGEARDETVTFPNGMPATITHAIRALLTQDVPAKLCLLDAPRGGNARLILKYQSMGEVTQIDQTIVKTVVMGVAQTGRQYSIQVVIEPKKK